jgi:hypothetical protein
VAVVGGNEYPTWGEVLVEGKQCTRGIKQLKWDATTAGTLTYHLFGEAAGWAVM